MPLNPKLATCTKCRKLFVPVLDDHKCPECAAEHEQKIFLVEHAVYFGFKTTIEEICEYTQLSHEEVLKILKNLRYLNETVVGEIKCARCKTETAQTGSEFCLDCRLFLHEQLKGATGNLSQKIAQRPQYPRAYSPVHSVMAELSRKRFTSSADIEPPRKGNIRKDIP